MNNSTKTKQAEKLEKIEEIEDKAESVIQVDKEVSYRTKKIISNNKKHKK